MADRPVCGIDPGLGGAFATLWPSGAVHVEDMPTMRAGDAGRRSLDLQTVADIMLDWRDQGAMVVVEAQQPMPKQGVRSTYTTGYGYGVLLGMMVALRMRHCTVRPQEWRRAMGLGKGKDAGRAKASELHPVERELWGRKSDDGRADAVLLAHYGASRIWPGSVKASESAVERRLEEDVG